MLNLLALVREYRKIDAAFCENAPWYSGICYTVNRIYHIKACTGIIKDVRFVEAAWVIPDLYSISNVFCRNLKENIRNRYCCVIFNLSGNPIQENVIQFLP